MTLAFLLAAGVAALGCALLIRYSARIGLIDEPNERSLHLQPVPRSGGLGLLLGVAAGMAALYLQGGSFPAWALQAAAAALAVAVVSLFDDYREVPAGLRLVVHLGASLTPVFCGLSFNSIPFPGFEIPMPGLLGPLFTVLFTAWMINLYNFMDGMDGFAGSMSLIGLATLSGLAALAGQGSYSAMAGVVAAASAGFLLFNRPPAKIFMGDVGSATLGYLISIFILWGAKQGAVEAWISVMVFSVFIVDATVTLIRRALNGEPLWKAHRSHHYQRLVQSGWSHARTTGVAILLMLGCAASAYLGRGAGPTLAWCIVVFWVLLYVALAWLITRYEARLKPNTKGATL